MTYSDTPPYVLCEDLFKIYKVADLEVVALMPGEGGKEFQLVTATRNRAIALSDEPAMLVIARDELWPRPWTRVAKWVVAGVSVAALGAGMTAHALHDGEIDKMNYGTVDTRSRAERWQKAAVGGYAVTATAAAGAILLFILDRPDEPMIDPLFPPMKGL